MSSLLTLQGAVTGSRATLVRSGRFIAGQLARMGSIGAVCESSRWLARRMAAAVQDATGPVVEFGAGYGAVTRLLPESTTIIERDPIRFEALTTEFPDRRVVHSCAVRYLRGLREPSIVVSSIPSVNNGEFPRLKAAMRQARQAGAVTQLVTYTYFPHDPFSGVFPNAELYALELLNVPPAFVWKYSC